jgi:hypothetical protein
MNRPLIFSAFILILSGIYSCKTVKVIQPEIMEVFHVEETFIQKEVPGLRSESPKEFMTIRISGESFKMNVIDSILIEGTNYSNYSKEEKTNFKLNPIKIRLQRVIIDHEFKPTEVFIYFTKDDKSYYQIVKNILIKEPLYLP